MSKCKMLGNEATPYKLREAHRVKMVAKKMTYKHFSEQYADRGRIFANQSARSEHYGETPKEQTARMLAKSS